jgi:hypothetical protein
MERQTFVIIMQHNLYRAKAGRSNCKVRSEIFNSSEISMFKSARRYNLENRLRLT